ncbi:MAG: metallophosphoesterase [Gammaproteobacteria bacterium]|nr:metallophosphoesterase [Gammaproteobacteria bacterium]
MKIQLLSDLHNEFLRHGKPDPGHLWMGVIPETDADIIVLAGDVDTGTKGIEWAISESERLAKDIIYVLGNHEYYGYEYISLREKIAQLTADTTVHCLDYDVFNLQDVRFIGATLWTDYKADVSVPQDLAMYYVNQALADHQKITYATGGEYRKFKPHDALAIHQKELSWLKKEIARPHEGKTVVITHHGPHPVCQHPGYPVSEISSAFHSDLSNFIEQHNIDVWAFGHTHANLDMVVTDTRIISNQAGYPGEKVKGFNAELIIDV